MGRKKSIYQYVDRTIFKGIGAAATGALFALVYYYLRFPADLGLGSTVGLVFPGVMVLIWELLKQRQFWWFWLAGGLICAVGVWLFAGMENILLHVYWGLSLAVCAALAVLPSRAAIRFCERDRENSVSFAPKARKDEFLEQLFADK